MQICKKCGIEKELLAFEFRKDNGLYRKVCRECLKPTRNANAKRNRSTLIGKYKMQQRNATDRGIPFLLTYEEWLQVWNDSGKLKERGRGADKFCMCRVGDLGSYEVSNVFIGTGRENVREGNLGKPVPQEVRDKISKSNSGKPHPWSVGNKNPMHRPEVKAKISAKIGGANHYKQRGVNTPQGYFVTAKAASEALGIPKPTVEWRARYNKFGFSLPELA
jgi:hypothetical protein